MQSLLGTDVVSQILVLDGRATCVLVNLSRRRVRGVKFAVGGGVLVQSRGRQSGRLVVNGGIVVRFVHRHRGVNDFRLDSFLLNHGLHVVVNVVMGTLSGHGWCGRGGMLGFMDGRCVFKLGLILVQPCLVVCLAAMVDGLVLGGKGIVFMLLGSADCISYQALPLPYGFEMTFEMRKGPCLTGLPDP